MIAVCNLYAESIRNNRPPHIIFDTTIKELTSSTVHSFTKSLALPIVSASYGQESDLRQWRTINEREEKYLLQVMPPLDIIPEVIRSLVLRLNITNAAILYDELFVMEHKYKALLQNIQTRHVITTVAKGERERSEQILKLRNLDMNNFFILGSLRTISQVLGKIFTFPSSRLRKKKE